MKSFKRYRGLIIAALLGLLLFWLWLRHTPFGELKTYFAQLNPLLVALAAVLYLSAYFVRSLRWRLLQNPLQKISVGESWHYSMAGNLLNYLIPIRAGELLKSWLIKRRYDLAMARSLPVVFIDKSFDTLAILVVILLLPFLAIKASAALYVLLALLFAVFLLSIIIILLAIYRKQRANAFLQKFFFWLPQRFKAKLESFIQLFVEGLSLFQKHPELIPKAVAFTIIGVFLDGLYFYLIFRAFGISFPFILTLLGYALINMSYAIPQPPAQLGSNEWMMIVIFSLGFGLTKYEASAIMAFAHLLTAMLMLVFGVLGVAVAGKGALRSFIKGESFDAKST